MSTEERKIISVVGSAVDPGGVAALMPVLRKLAEANVGVTFVGSETSASAASRAYFTSHTSIGSWDSHVVTARHTLEESKPDLVITATSIEPGPEMALLREAKRLGIPVLCQLDSWTNYLHRFLAPGETKLSDMGLPDILTVMDSFARDEMLSEGFPSSILRVVGNPSFDRLVEYVRSGTFASERNKLRAELGLTDKPLVAFFSQPIAEDCRLHGMPPRGYDQVKAFGALEKACCKAIPEAQIVIKPHPREQFGLFDSIASMGADQSLVLRSIDTFRLIAAADVVVSMTSITLVEAALLGRPVISLQPGLNGDDLLVLNRMGITIPVIDTENLPGILRDCLAAQPNDVFGRLPEMWVDGLATLRTINVMQEMVASP